MGRSAPSRNNSGKSFVLRRLLKEDDRIASYLGLGDPVRLGEVGRLGLMSQLGSV